MLDSKIVKICKEQIFFLGTAVNQVVHVRPMKLFVDEKENVWLVSHKGTDKTKEIEVNNVVELCTVDDNTNVLRLQGKLLQRSDMSPEEMQQIRQQLFEGLPGIKDFFQTFMDPDMVVYQLDIDRVIFRSLNAALKEELHFKK
ncbi:MAG: pyridoxamine 5'-phosphate oxidase family protein [Megasphaera sp.]|jgi:general stress protein 26|uniref:pyridoxamine 5'-phosphate oxidase family protein n=1 Tax=Megasphaera sueciensis TaxID=349094 RepID=UPI003D02BA6E|nr:pyridoxamine 5'-phosphate oxidase family protein [Megasphaera sp.]